MSNTDKALHDFMVAVVSAFSFREGVSRSGVEVSQDRTRLEWTITTSIGTTVAYINAGTYRTADRYTRAIQIAEQDAIDVLHEKRRKEVSSAVT